MSASNLGIDFEDLNLDILPAIETSFGITFEPADLTDVRTYGDLCAAVQRKLPSAPAGGCTSQQAFYKLRQALHPYTARSITPATRLADILPPQRAQRQRAIAAIEQTLGMKLEMLGMPPSVEITACLLLLVTIIFLVASGYIMGVTGVLIGLGGVGVASAILHIGGCLGNTLSYTTVRDVVNTMSSKFYRQSRREPATVNQSEITTCLTHLFMDMSGVERAALSPDAIL